MPRPRKSRLLPSITTYTEELVRTIASEFKKALLTSTESLQGELKELRRELGRLERRTEKFSQPRGRGGRPKSHKTCTVRGCGQPHVARGLCKNHYQQARYEEKKRDMGMSVRRRSPGPAPVPEGSTATAAAAPPPRKRAAKVARARKHSKARAARA